MHVAAAAGFLQALGSSSTAAAGQGEEGGAVAHHVMQVPVLFVKVSAAGKCVANCLFVIVARLLRWQQCLKTHCSMLAYQAFA